MKSVTRSGYLAYARLPVFQCRLEEARSVIRSALLRMQNPYVAYSAGKDSGCLLYLVLEQSPTVSARILTSGESRLLHGNLDQVLAWWRERFPSLDLQEINIDRIFSEEWKDADWTTQRKAGRGDIVKFLPATGQFDGVFLGLRDEESNKRRIANKKGLIRQYSVQRKDGIAGMWCCCPLAQWTVQDVGAFVCLHDLPLLAAYEAEGLDARTTMRLTGDAARQNAVVMLRQRDPGRFNALLQRFPELSWWDS